MLSLTLIFISIEQLLTLELPQYDGQPSYVEIDCEVEWRESMKFLKVEFPVNVTNKEASYETQFGIMKRPTHYNTT